MLILGGPSGNSWEQFKIIIDPEELVEILNEFDFYLFKTCQSSENYLGSTKDDLYEEYANYWRIIISNENNDLKFDKIWFNRFIITDNSNDIEIVYHEQEKLKYIKEINPVIWVDTFSLLFQDFRLTTNEFFIEGNIGINFIFPKKYGNYNNGRIDYYESELSTNYQLYKLIRDSFYKRVKQIKILKEQKIFKPNVYISDKAKERINCNSYLRKIGLLIN